mmetsp:Transcript_1865/g.2154  ORF Transcript_1865/g.2154 Transcript_1865/m.2154 type:complete len:116 (-) Transcript_1865:625-972(-)|eukprot:CAMPEP_0184017056 /NCGR_PEP_ID=MMETSP0954-20121128/7294_1 /TAXON_ID=627963 /ORGANISM="Aplanochytrium sp, Strain PBS07" /LENGTH=115 /DNA_ID=CAMNT_0026298189 /DNA_START=325 /DNA_END=672 /DNA_ORIENTATION=+
MHFPGALSLMEELDRWVLVILRDGRHLVGRLTSFDQFSNLVLEEAKEWMIFKDLLSEQDLGCFIVRSDNVVIISQLDNSKLPNMKLRRVSIEEMNLAREKAEDDGEDESETKWNF